PNSALDVGSSGSGNHLLVNDGGRVRTFSANIGSGFCNNNEADLIGAGSSWTNMDLVHVGAASARSRLVVSNGALFFSSVGVSVGDTASSTNNRVVVDGGTLLLNNTNATASLDVRRGTNVLNAGLIDVGQLLLTNTQGFFEFKGGTLITRGA